MGLGMPEPLQLEWGLLGYDITLSEYMDRRGLPLQSTQIPLLGPLNLSVASAKEYWHTDLLYTKPGKRLPCRRSSRTFKARDFLEFRIFKAVHLLRVLAGH